MGNGFDLSVETIAGMCLVWVPIAIWCIMMINWMIVGEIETLAGLVGLGFGVTLGVLSVNPPDPGLRPLFFAAAVITLILTPITRLTMDRMALASFDIEAIERAYEMLRSKPDNYAAKLRLAKALYNKGLILHAVAICEEALRPASDVTFSEEKYMLKRWKGQIGMVQNPTRDIRCINCNELNEPGHILCKKCGHAFLLSYAKGQFIKPSIAKRLVACWMFAMMAILGIPLSLTAFAPLVAIGVIIFLFVVGTYFLIRAFRDDKAVTV
ncbi:MAG: tetratricopeptide repeat protein [Fimbriimonadaceae bacterium]|nr:tetratricopeptide repeat protein [Fimbriimonadaceae bacterium]